jgi:putative hydrolase of the HAD superfamily
MDAALRAVLFDFDGTLGYYRPSHLDLYVEAAAERGVVVTVAALRAAVDVGWAPWETVYGVDHSAHSADEASFASIRAMLHLGRYAAAGVTADAAVMQAVAERLVEAEADPGHFGLYEDTVPALERVRAAGLRSYIVSNHIWRLPEVVEALGLYRPHGGGLVAGVLTSARVGYRKPHPEIFRAAALMAGEAPGALLYVGDNVAHDVQGARAAGMRAVLIDRDAKSADASAIRTLMEVPL